MGVYTGNGISSPGSGWERTIGGQTYASLSQRLQAQADANDNLG